MLIEIESVYGDKVLHGKALTLNVLRDCVNTILEQIDEKDFSSAFCARLNYEEISCIDTDVDYIIDLDTRLVYAPKY